MSFSFRNVPPAAPPSSRKSSTGKVKRRKTRTRQNPLRLSLSYTEMCLNTEGAVLQRDQIEELRQRQGFCPTCPGEPVQLFDIQRSRFNPLLSSREARSVAGECDDGVCLRCNPRDLLGSGSRRDRRGSLSRQTANRMTSTSIRGGFSSLDDDDQRQEGNDVNGQVVANGSSGTSVRFREQQLTDRSTSGSMMQSVAVRLSETMETLAEVTATNDEEDDDDEDDDARIAKASRALRLSEKSVELPKQEQAPLEQQYKNTRNTQTSRLSGTSSSAALEGRYEDCRRDSRERATRKSTLVGLKMSPRDLREIDSMSDNEDEVDTRTSRSADESDQVVTSSSEDNKDPEQVLEKTIKDLDILVADLMATGNPDFAVDALTYAMKSHPKAEAIQVFCLGTIWNFCKTNSKVKESVISTTAPEDALLAMKTHLNSALVQERGCGIVRALSDCSNNRKVMLRVGAIARILRALEEHPDDEHVVSAAVGALRSLSPDEEVRVAYLALDVKSIVLAAMELHRQVEAIQRDGIAFLSNTAIGVKDSKVAVVSLEEVESIVLAMQAHQTNMSVKSVVSIACFALKNYTFDEKNVRTLMQCNDVRPILEMAAECSVDPACRNDAESVLDQLSLSQAMHSSMRQEDSFQSFTDELVCDKSLDELLMTIRSNDVGVEEAFETMVKHARESESCRAKIAESGALQDIVSAMRVHGDNPRIQQGGCEVFESMMDEALDVIDAGGCRAIVNAIEIHGGDEMVLIAAFKALKVLSVHFECWFELEQTGLMSVFRDTFNRNLDGCDTVNKEGTEILMNFSAYSG